MGGDGSTTFRTIVVLVVVTLIALAVGWPYLLYSKRTKAKAVAEALLLEWEVALGEKSSALFELDRSKTSLLGDPRQAGSYRGRTKDLAEEVITGVGRLFIMYTAASGMLDRAK